MQARREPIFFPCKGDDCKSASAVNCRMGPFKDLSVFPDIYKQEVNDKRTFYNDI